MRHQNSCFLDPRHSKDRTTEASPTDHSGKRLLWRCFMASDSQGATDIWTQVLELMVPEAESESRVNEKEFQWFSNKCWAIHLPHQAKGISAKVASISSPVLRSQSQGRPCPCPHFCCHSERGNLSSWRSAVCTSRAHTLLPKGPFYSLVSYSDSFYPIQTGGDLLYCLEFLSLIQVSQRIRNLKGMLAFQIIQSKVWQTAGWQWCCIWQPKEEREWPLPF